MKALIALASGLAILLTGCSSVRLESSEKNPDIVLFHASKLLVVGMSSDTASREAFESRMQNAFQSQGVETVRSIDLFDVAFTHSERSEEELDRFERELLDKDFDAILFTKVVGSETRASLRKKIREVGESYDRFREDYLLHQGIYYDRSYYELATDYFTETSLYCICEGKERNLIWRAGIEISNPRDIDKVVKDYVEVLLAEMENLQLIIGTEVF
ncbi:MAG TPA: hypothetical protein VLL47_05065 [Robiginitalea sp.]|nr:hypothetical protein [Robiginitalea sp.]